MKEISFLNCQRGFGNLFSNLLKIRRKSIGEDHGLLPPPPRAPPFIIALALLIALQTGTPAWAWGRLGHRVISRIAEMNLKPKAKAAIAALLDQGERENVPGRHSACDSIE